jgi:uncharacterized protein YecE (DUF72 family)
LRLLAGSSGFSYPEWKGSFYPTDLPQKGFLAHYAGRLPAVEINNTFYRMPKAEMLARWAEQVPEGFRFVLKAPQRITHRERLAGSADSLAYFWKNAQTLGARLGPVLFQLPPFLRLDLDRLRSFLTELPAGLSAAFEFRHDSWFVPELEEVLRDAGAALCISDTDPDPEGEPDPGGVPQCSDITGTVPLASGETPVGPGARAEADEPLPVTAGFGYLRLRRASYSDRDLGRWAERIRCCGWEEVFVFFKHEDEGAGPLLAARLLERFAAPAAAQPAASAGTESDTWR